MIAYLLDTDACVFLMNGTRAALAERVAAARPDEVAISVVTAAELRYGAEKSAVRERSKARLRLLLSGLTALPFDLPAVEAYGVVRAALEARGRPIGPLDTLIAAHAVSIDATLVTSNVREFRRVRGLRVEDWAAG